jgi:hypothetical protein
MPDKPLSMEKEVKKAGLILINKIYYNSKFREKARKDFTKMRDMGVEMLESLPNVASLKVGKDRILSELLIDVGARYLEIIRKAEREYKFHDQRGTFILFKKENTYVFNMKTLRDKKIREGNIIFLNGLPAGSFKKTILIHKTYDFKGFAKLDSGKYHMKQLTGLSGYFRYWGKSKKYVFDFERAKIIYQKEFEIMCRQIKT